MLNPAASAAQQRIYQAALKLFALKGSTELNVSELAAEAGVARGTIYNHVTAIDELFKEVADVLASEMNQRILLSFRQQPDPDIKLANGIRLYVKRAHDEPYWGLFVSRFAFSSELRRLGAGAPMKILMDGIAHGRYSMRPDQLSSSVILMGSSVVGAMYLVREGLRTWRDAGSDCAEMVLRALGLPPERARAIAQAPLSTPH